VIEQLEPEESRSVQHAACHRQVVGGGLGVAGGMVVGHEETLGVSPDDGGEDL
jgi:hypothetical protein